MIAIIGGGAAGFFAAIQAAQNGCEVAIIEASNQLLSKVRVSGGGRCNVTNGATSIQELLEGYPRGNKELRGPFTRFNNQDVQSWLEQRGVDLKIEEDGRVFPVSDDSGTIISCFMREVDRLGVKIICGFKVQKINRIDSGFELVADDRKISANRVIITAGGSRKLSGYDWISSLGINIIEPVPSLFTFNTPQGPFKQLMGISFKDVEVAILGTKFKTRGALLFTHWGLSGPAILKLSSIAARKLHELDYVFRVSIDFLPDEEASELNLMFRNIKSTQSRKQILSFRHPAFSSRFWEVICQISNIQSGLDWGNISNTQLDAIVTSLKSVTLQVRGKTTFKDEFVTCGGVDLKEVDFKSMQSKRIPGIYFAGEVLDIDGITGGYNFQAAWTTGYIAGSSACESK
ncbi:MAG: NAD(P)/FAD-dependent oxidoreductase [Bacteroidota bacterium]|jgi:predicted Rossmann fold flavoprotein